MANSETGLEHLGILQTGEYLGVGNEFTGALIRKVWTRQGERLEITIPKTGTRIFLDAMQLEILADQDSRLFTDLLANKLDRQSAQ